MDYESDVLIKRVFKEIFCQGYPNDPFSGSSSDKIEEWNQIFIETIEN